MQADILDKTTVQDFTREVSRLQSVVTDAVNDGFKTAMKTIEQGREAAEDMVDDATRAIRRNPRAMGIAFAAGVVLGGFAIWMSRR